MSTKAQLLILSRYFRAVKPLLIVLMVLAISVSSCGFRLNRNQITLPENARSISLENIENKSYTPGLDITLKSLLIDRFSRNSVSIQPGQAADLSLLFQISSAGYSRHDYALDNTTKSYEFIFAVSGSLSVVNNSLEEHLISGQVLSGSYSFKTESTDLTITEVSDGRLKALESLAEQILNKLSQNF